MKQEQQQSVDLPSSIVDRVEQRLPRTEFDTSSEYITYILEEILYHVEEETNDEVETADEDQVRNRLKSLGYLDE